MCFSAYFDFLFAFFQSFHFKQDILEIVEREKCDPFGCKTEILKVPVLDEKGNRTKINIWVGWQNYKNILKADENNYKTYLPIGLVLIFISLILFNLFFKPEDECLLLNLILKVALATPGMTLSAILSILILVTSKLVG